MSRKVVEIPVEVWEFSLQDAEHIAALHRETLRLMNENARLNAEVGRILAAPRFTEALQAQGAVPGGGTPAEMARFLDAELAKWAEVIRAGNIKPD